MSQEVGLIGVGLMGHGIGVNIQKSRYALNFLNHAGNQPVDDLIELGAISHDSIATICKKSTIIVLCVTGAPQVEDIVFNGVCPSIQTGTLVIDCSTSLPETTLKVSQAIVDLGGKYIDAPMTRTPKEAAEGRLNLLVGGLEQDYQSALTLLETFAENIVHTGPVASGHAMKLLHNFVSLSLMGVISEAASCAKKAGVDPEVFVEVLRNGGGYGAGLDRLEGMITKDDPSALQFTLSNAAKDIGYYSGMAKSFGNKDDIAKAMGKKLEGAISDLSPEAFVPELVKY